MKKILTLALLFLAVMRLSSKNNQIKKRPL